MDSPIPRLRHEDDVFDEYNPRARRSLTEIFELVADGYPTPPPTPSPPKIGQKKWFGRLRNQNTDDIFK